MSDDPYEDQSWLDYAQRAIDDLLPKMRDSGVVISMVPKGPGDVKFAVELGFSIMLDKPIIALIQPGSKVSAKLTKVADEIVEFDPEAAPVETMKRLGPILEKWAKGGDDDAV